MEFLKAYTEAEKLGLTFDTFKSIWDKESESKHLSVQYRLLELETERSRMGLSRSPEPNLSSSDQSKKILRETKNIYERLKQLNSNIDNILTEINNSHHSVQITLEKSVENQNKLSQMSEKILEIIEKGNDKIMKEFCNVVKYIREQSKYDTDLIRTYIQQECQFLYHGQVRNTATKTPAYDCLLLPLTTDASSQLSEQVITDVHGRIENSDVVTDVHFQPEYSDVFTQSTEYRAASNTNADVVADIVSVLTKSYSDTTNNTSDVVPTSLDMRHSPKDVAVVRQLPVSDQYGHDIVTENVQNKKTDGDTAQELRSETEAGASPRQSTMRRFSRHWKTDSNAKTNSIEKNQGKQMDQTEEKAQDKEEEKLEEKKQGKQKDQTEEKVQVKEKEQVKEKSQSKDEDKAENQTQAEVKNQADELSPLVYKRLGVENQASSEEKTLNKRKRTHPLQYSSSFIQPNWRHTAWGSEKPNRIRRCSDSSTLELIRNDFSRRSFRVVDPVAKFIPDTGLSFEVLTSYFNTPSFYETDYFYTRPKKCRVKLRLTLKKDNALSVQLCVSQGATVGEPTWPIYFDGIGKIYNAETMKPSLLWRFNQSCRKPDQDEEVKLDATICLITKYGSYQVVTFDLLMSHKFEIDNYFRFFWKLTAD